MSKLIWNEFLDDYEGFLESTSANEKDAFDLVKNGSRTKKKSSFNLTGCLGALRVAVQLGLGRAHRLRVIYK